MTGKLLVVDLHRFLYTRIRGYWHDQVSVWVVRENLVDLVWGPRFRTGLEQEKTLVDIVCLDYGGEIYFFHDSLQLQRSIALLREMKGRQELVDWTVVRERGLEKAYNDYSNTRHWHYIDSIQPVIWELEQNWELDQAEL